MTADWRSIRCVDVRWEYATGERNKMGGVRLALYSLCNARRQWSVGEYHWVGKTLGELADDGPMSWRQGRVGRRGIEAVKLIIDRAAAGLEVCKPPPDVDDPWAPYSPRPYTDQTDT
jgi:hypothetical protein